MQLIVCNPKCHCIVVASVNESVSTGGLSQEILYTSLVRAEEFIGDIL